LILQALYNPYDVGYDCYNMHRYRITQGHYNTAGRRVLNQWKKGQIGDRDEVLTSVILITLPVMIEHANDKNNDNNCSHNKHAH